MNESRTIKQRAYLHFQIPELNYSHFLSRVQLVPASIVTVRVIIPSRAHQTLPNSQLCAPASTHFSPYTNLSLSSEKKRRNILWAKDA